MKDLKFRAWDELNKIMHNDFQFIRSGTEGNDWILFVSDKQSLVSFNWKENPYFAQQIKIMQFTGLKDKNGKDVFDGDILLVDEIRIVKVVWHNEAGCWDTIFISEKLFNSNFRSLENHSWFCRTEIIGNIYENPELL